MASSVTDPYTLLCGASGGCYALIGAHFAIVIMNWKEMTQNWQKGVMNVMCSAPMRLFLWSILVCFDIGMAVYNRYGPNNHMGVSYAAHVGGAIAGLLVGIPVLKNFDVKPWEKVVFWISVAVYVLGVAIAIGFNLLRANYPKTDWRPCCPVANYNT
ncbi:hypothetical protein NP493_1683g00003 [Ridgeia piscesae]|uniref:Peptidase S54 rhomboid domain-containing protein n=1 Tax=Ridgeia piscesae TaxID=27915 RepID=A0AAD9JW16_RIDPI|nr:hypothetical protein NP493_1683g00003 [Ridgeia piscesae]